MSSTAYFARWVLLPSGEILENGGVVVSGNRIASVGSRGRIRRSSQDRIVNLGPTLLMPGLINMHTHLEQGIIRGMIREENEAFSAWRAKRDGRLSAIKDETIASSVRLAIRESLANGVTTVVDSSNRTISPDVFKDEPIRSWVIHEVAPLDSASEESVIETLHSRITKSEHLQNLGIGPHAFYSLAPDSHRALIRAANANGYLWAAHLAESAEELQAFSEQRGDLYFRITRRKKWPFGNTERGVMYTAITENLIPNHALCFHCNYVSGQELSLLAAKNVTIVVAPRYTEAHGHKPFPLDIALARKINLCIGTESPSSFAPLNLFDELFHLKRAHPYIPAQEMLRWVTVNAARALRCSDRLGAVGEGMLADLVGVRFPHAAHEDLLEELIAAEPEVVFVMVDGEEVIAGY
ncbi:MAG: amidohydrolase family protein [Chitinivibrionales bacterium]|nr:amidohydrolase family protein [Chitinivibrionales bacterium]MBD3356613.1 amidohydrolase family protein [Chitinivibrionales bacterium]